MQYGYCKNTNYYAEDKTAYYSQFIISCHKFASEGNSKQESPKINKGVPWPSPSPEHISQEWNQQ